MIKFFEKLLNIIYLQPCFYCKSTKEDSLICKKCYNKIHFLPSAVLRKFMHCKIYAATLYDEVIKELIKQLKYKNKKHLAKLQAEIMYKYWQELNIKDNFIILPVPIHELRRKERKYNHMDLCAEEFAKLTNMPVNKNFLLRTKDTKKQFKLKRQERIENIKNAFALNEKEEIDNGQNLLILDDITSTGITIEEIIRLLNKNGYNKITAFALSTPDIWN